MSILRIEVVRGALKSRWPWIWRLRSDNDSFGSEFLAIGGANTEWQAKKRAEAVKTALVHVYPWNEE